MNSQQIDRAVEHFRALLNEQVARAQRLERGAETARQKRGKMVIGIAGGDGIGPIIVQQARRALACVLADKLAAGTVELREIEGLTLENRMACGESVPQNVLRDILECDVLLKGPTATPAGGSSMESANVTLRRSLDLYANVRPVRIPEENIDWTFFRENTEGEYALGSRGVDLDGMAVDFKVTTDAGTRRIARAAFEFAKNNGKSRVAIVTKANILKKTDGKFRDLCFEVAREYPDIEAEEWYIDIMSANLVNPALRSRFQVFLLPNLYGDILTDEAAQLQGGVGTAGSANIGDQYAMFEAIHGTAPRMIAQGLGAYADPESILRAAELLLRHIGCVEAADRLSRALHICCEQERKCVVTGDKDGATCEQFGDYLLQTLNA